ncbi:MAG: sigma-70 family RNA polymerase sigma factor, partial [Planctomycetota bacterium]
MDSTRHSLLGRLMESEQTAWDEVDAIYRPLIRNWLGRYRLQASDVDDLTQEVLAVLVKQIGSFEHNGRVGAFRNWLRTTTVNVARNLLRKRNLPIGGGGSEFQASLAQLEDPESKLSKQFDIGHSRFVIAHLLGRIERDFQDVTLRIFRMHVMEGVSVSETAERLGVS